MRRLAVAFALVASALPVLTACGGGGSAPPAGTIKIEMVDFAFKPAKLTVKSGAVSFYLVNDGSNAHDMTIAAPTGGGTLAASELVQPGATAVFKVSGLRPGTYTFYCSVPGHRDAGMQGTLTAN
ncbi:MAG: cupredoxin domain-containing protein [Candidatus Dormibacteraceae bacterium]